jgi:hypothetical protein
LSTTNSTCHDLGLNPSCRGGKPATNRLSYGTAFLPDNSLALLFDTVRQSEKKLSNSYWSILHHIPEHSTLKQLFPFSYSRKGVKFTGLLCNVP